MSKIDPISLLQPASDISLYSCYVDKDKQLYEAVWKDIIAYPDFTYTPLRRVDLGAKAAVVWSKSSLLDFRSGGFVRRFNKGAFPVVKIAYLNRTLRI